MFETLCRRIRACFDLPSGESDAGLFLKWTFLLSLLAAAWMGGLNTLSAVGALQGLLCALAPFVLGWALGFLFGLPHTPETVPAVPSGGAGYAPGGHLEAIADWLTKIIVGVGLVEWERFRDAFVRVAREVGPVFSSRAPLAVSGSVLVFFILIGLLSGYLSTRLYLAKRMADADRTLNRPDPADVERMGRTAIDPLTGALVDADPGAASALSAFPMNIFSTPRALSAWGKARLAVGDRTDALMALEKAVGAAPGDAAPKRDLAALLKKSDPERAARLLKEISELSMDPAKLGVRMLACLYQDPPAGFEEVIRTLEPIIDQSAYGASSDLHAYLACAYGQQASFEDRRQADFRTLPRFESLKGKALAQVARALDLDRDRWAATLTGCLWPAPGAPDDDLRIFGEAPEFKQLFT